MSSEETKPLFEAATGRELLVNWANEQDPWVRLLVGEALTNRGPVAEAIVEIAFDHFLGEKGLNGSVEPVADLVLERTQEDEAGKLQINKLHEVEGVNALTTGQEIDFNTGLTVLFGENAAGKTGYARILKSVAAVRTAEQILPNVRKPASGAKPKATIDYSVADDKRHLAWSGEQGVAPFTQICIFDSAAVALHVDEQLTYIYTPADLELFGVVAEALDAVRTKLEEAIAARNPGGNPFLSRFQKGTSVYPVIETLGAATDLSKLASFAVSDEERDKLQLFKNRVTALSGSSSDAQLSVAKARGSFFQSVEKAAETASAFQGAEFVSAIAEAEGAEKSVRELRGALLNALGLSAEAEEDWESFVIDGEALQEHLESHEYPAEGEPCLYCQQPLGTEAVSVLLRYRGFATDSARKLVSQARQRATDLSASLVGLDLPRLRREFDQRKENDGEDPALAAAEVLIAALEERMPGVRSAEKTDWSSVPELATQAKDLAATRREAAEKSVEELSAEAVDRAKNLAEAKTDLAELEAKIELEAVDTEIQTYVENAKWSDQAGKLIRRWQPLQKQLTDVSKIASKQLLNADFEKRFLEECKALNAPKVEVEYPGSKGKAARRKVITDQYRLSQVLSEGEQKALALADFLAEASIRKSPAPIVFDDPVTSLDYRRVNEVAERIAELSAERQVIVFTHDIWLAALLVQRFEKNKPACSYYDVESDPEIGTVRAGSSPRWGKPNEIKKQIDSLIESAKDSEGVARDALIRQAYSELRAWCETVVEQKLLKGITQRYQPHVRMSALSEIKWDRIAAAATRIEQVFKDACRVTEAHSQPTVTHSVKPRLEDLEADWKEAREALASVDAKDDPPKATS